MKSCLIVYYSRTGVTEAAALALARASGADVEALRPQHTYRNAFGFLRALWDAVHDVAAPIAPVRHNPADYPFIVLGTPVWAGRASAPMRSYILQQQHHFHRVAVFCTMGGRSGDKAMHDMAILCHREPFARLCLREREIRTGCYLERITRFSAELGRLGEATPSSPISPRNAPRNTSPAASGGF